MDFKLNTIEEAIEDFREGKFLIVVDDEDRENEGDFIIAAEKITPEKVNFMMQYGRGVLCAPMSADRCRQLDLEMQVRNNTSLLGTPFTITVDLLGHGCTTGVSMFDRASTIKALTDPDARPEMFGRPGHIFAFGDFAGATNFSTRASSYRKQIHANYSLTNRNYNNRFMFTYASGLMKNGWAVAASASTRFGTNLSYVDGSSYLGGSYFVSAEKQFNSEHALNLSVWGAPTRRSLQSNATQEVYDGFSRFRWKSGACRQSHDI